MVDRLALCVGPLGRNGHHIAVSRNSSRARNDHFTSPFLRPLGGEGVDTFEPERIGVWIASLRTVLAVVVDRPFRSVGVPAPSTPLEGEQHASPGVSSCGWTGLSPEPKTGVRGNSSITSTRHRERVFAIPQCRREHDTLRSSCLEHSAL
jgi:hypothetical protein